MKFTNKNNLPDALYRAVSRPDYDPGVGSDITTSRLIKPAQAVCLTKQHHDKLETDIVDGIPALFGTAMHKVLEVNTDPNVITEERYYVRVNGRLAEWNISGQIDLYDPATKTLYDYKVCSVWRKILGAGPEWEHQMNVNAWLMENNGIQVDRLVIVAIFRDWSRTEAMRSKDENYPKGWAEKFEIEVWSAAQQEQYIRDRMDLHQRAQINNDYKECTDEETWARNKKWKVKKIGNQKATRVFGSADEASTFAAQKGSDYRVIYQPPVRPMCQHYCPAAAVCPQKERYDKELLESQLWN